MSSKQGIADVKKWLRSIGKYSDKKAIAANTQIEITKNTKTKLAIRLYTERHSYSIVAEKKTKAERGYLGCVVSKRKPRAGEKHTRGSDLADGALTLETWNRILGDIVSYELVELGT